MTWLIALALLSATLLIVWPRRVQVTRIVDGDSIEVRRGRKHLRVRIAHLDAPEYKQPGGRASLRHLEWLLVDQRVRLCIGKTDVYGRTVARCLVNGTPVNWLMIRAGHAWPTSLFGQLLSIPARIKGRGLWGDPQRLHPTHWRRLYAHRHPGVMID